MEYLKSYIKNPVVEQQEIMEEIEMINESWELGLTMGLISLVIALFSVDMMEYNHKKTTGESLIMSRYIEPVWDNMKRAFKICVKVFKDDKLKDIFKKLLKHNDVKNMAESCNKGQCPTKKECIKIIKSKLSRAEYNYLKAKSYEISAHAA